MTAKGQRGMTGRMRTGDMRSRRRQIAATTQPVPSHHHISDLLDGRGDGVCLSMKPGGKRVGADDEGLNLVLAEPDQRAATAEAESKRKIEESHGHFPLRLKIADRTEATAAPIDPFAGLEMEGAGGLETLGIVGFGAAGTPLGVSATPVNVMVGSSAIIAMSRPAQPSCSSTLFGSNTPSRTNLPDLYWSVPAQT